MQIGYLTKAPNKKGITASQPFTTPHSCPYSCNVNLFKSKIVFVWVDLVTKFDYVFGCFLYNEPIGL